MVLVFLIWGFLVQTYLQVNMLFILNTSGSVYKTWKKEKLRVVFDYAFEKDGVSSSSARQLPRKHANSFRSSPKFFKNFLQVFSTTKSTLFHLNTLKSSSPSLATPFLKPRRRPRGLYFSDPKEVLQRLSYNPNHPESTLISLLLNFFLGNRRNTW